MDSSKKTIFKVGIFLVIGLVVVMASILVLGTNRSLFKPVIKLKSQFASVQGLDVGSVVSFSGLVAGNIEAVNYLREQRIIEITMVVDADIAKNISKDSVIEIKTQGALGDKYLYISPGSIESPAVSDMDYLKADNSSDLLSIVAKRGNETEKVFDIINNLHVATTQLVADRRIDRITSHLALAAQNFSTASQDAKRVMADLNLKPSIEKLDRILGKIDRGEGTLGGLINDPSVHNSLKGFLGVSGKKSHLRSLIKSGVDSGSD